MIKKNIIMFGQSNLICIAGKNQCAIDFVKYAASKISKNNIVVLPNTDDNGKDNWQPSLKKYALQNKYKILTLSNLYKIKNLIFISIEYEDLIKIDKFSTNELFNFHFSLLPKYRGCHTNFFQIYNGEKYSGVTLHKIDNGIDTGPIIDKIKFKIDINSNAYDNYLILMKSSVLLLKKNFNNILQKKYKSSKQKKDNSSYFSRKSVNYNSMKIFNINKINFSDFNKIKAFIFPPFQLPIVNKKKVSKIKYLNKKIRITYD